MRDVQLFWSALPRDLQTCAVLHQRHGTSPNHDGWCHFRI